jgi:GDP-mannose 6-dehydrogenase
MQNFITDSPSNYLNTSIEDFSHENYDEHLDNYSYFINQENKQEYENKGVKCLQKLKISIVGMGYVGDVSAACFCKLGHQVVGVDVDKDKIDCLNAGKSPIYENGLDQLLVSALDNKRFYASKNLNKAVQETDTTLISVCTPSNHDGSCNLSYLKQATEQIGHELSLKSAYHLVIFRSTTPPTTTRDILIPILENASGKKVGKDIGVCFNPEFLRESTAIEDFFNPPKIVIGSVDEKSFNQARLLYSSFTQKIIKTSIESAEFVKYIDNTWHALKVSFANEVGRICKSVDVDSHDVMKLFLEDRKLNISANYLMPGGAFGGSCLPKDTRGISNMAKNLHVETPLINSINNSNDEHLDHIMNTIRKQNTTNIGIIGLSFKPGTDDLRESPSVKIIKQLITEGYTVSFYDPFITDSAVIDINTDANKAIKSCQAHCLKTFTESCQTLVFTHKEFYADSITRHITSEHHIIDLVRLPEHVSYSDHYSGICW